MIFFHFTHTWIRVVQNGSYLNLRPSLLLLIRHNPLIDPRGKGVLWVHSHRQELGIIFCSHKCTVLKYIFLPFVSPFCVLNEIDDLVHFSLPDYNSHVVKFPSVYKWNSRLINFLTWKIISLYLCSCVRRLRMLFMYLVSGVILLCRTRVTLKRDGVVLDLVPPPTKVHNLIFGRTWIDSPGDMVMTNLTTGEKVVLYFQPCGWFGYYFLFLVNIELLS